MNNLGTTYSKLGMHHDALKLQQTGLALWRRVLPEDHPDLGTGMANLAFSCVTRCVTRLL
jgi:hypothetical protein